MIVRALLMVALSAAHLFSSDGQLEASGGEAANTSALHLAVLNENVDRTKALLASGADANAKNH